MKKTALVSLFFALLMISCNVQQQLPQQSSDNYREYQIEPENITQSLFSDKDATISEENIQRILAGTYSLPAKIRVGIVNLENNQNRRYNWNNEDYLSSRQKYLETMIKSLENNPRVQTVSLIPQLLLPSNMTFSSIREAAVRMQADIVIVYSASSGMYSNYNLFKGSTYKAFATTQALVIDTRTGLVPFTKVISKDVVAKKTDDDFNADEARKRIQEDAVMKTLNEVCSDLDMFLKK